MPTTSRVTPKALTTTLSPSSSPDSQPVRSHGTAPATTPGATTRKRRLPPIARELHTALALRRAPEQEERDAGPPMPVGAGERRLAQRLDRKPGFLQRPRVRLERVAVAREREPDPVAVPLELVGGLDEVPALDDEARVVVRPV